MNTEISPEMEKLIGLYSSWDQSTMIRRMENLELTMRVQESFLLKMKAFRNKDLLEASIEENERKWKKDESKLLLMLLVAEQRFGLASIPANIKQYRNNE